MNLDIVISLRFVCFYLFQVDHFLSFKFFLQLCFLLAVEVVPVLADKLSNLVVRELRVILFVHFEVLGEELKVWSQRFPWFLRNPLEQAHKFVVLLQVFIIPLHVPVLLRIRHRVHPSLLKRICDLLRCPIWLASLHTIVLLHVESEEDFQRHTWFTNLSTTTAHFGREQLNLIIETTEEVFKPVVRLLDRHLMLVFEFFCIRTLAGNAALLYVSTFLHRTWNSVKQTFFMKRNKNQSLSLSHPTSLTSPQSIQTNDRSIKQANKWIECILIISQLSQIIVLPAVEIEFKQFTLASKLVLLIEWLIRERERPIYRSIKSEIDRSLDYLESDWRLLADWHWRLFLDRYSTPVLRWTIKRFAREILLTSFSLHLLLLKLLVKKKKNIYESTHTTSSIFQRTYAQL